MAGDFTPSVLPVRPGAYFDFDSVQQPPTLVNTTGIVAVPFTHSWGPANQIVTMNSFGDFLAFFGQGGTTPPAYTAGYIAMLQCFEGEGLPGRGGAGQVLGYRMVGAAGAAAAVTLENSLSVPVVTLTARYEGSYGDQISVMITINPDTTREVSIYVEGALVETWEFADTGPGTTSLIAEINAGSAWVSAALVTPGVTTPPEPVSSPVSLTGGNDGAVLAAGDWTAMLTLYATSQFAIFAPFALDPTETPGDSSGAILAALLAWGTGNPAINPLGMNCIGRRCMIITGGALGESAVTASARAAALNDPNFITIGVGSYQDAVLGALSTSQLAPRLAGILAARTEAQGISFARLAGLSITAGAAASDILTGIANGFMTISQDSNPLAPVRFEKGLTTYTTTTNAAEPYAVFSNPKFVRSMQSIETEITEWAESNVIGLLPVNAQTIQYLLGNAQKRFKTREANQIVLPGWAITQQQNPPPTPTDDFISLVYAVQFTRDVEQVFNTVTVS